MKEESSSEITHPAGDRALVVGPIADGPVIVDTYLGRVKVDWDPEANVTALGHLAFFVEYLKSGGRLDALVADCPLTYTSPNRMPKTDPESNRALSRLANVLDKQQRLTLQRHKTRIFAPIDFWSYSRHMIEDRPINDEEDRVLKLVRKYSGG